MAGYVEPFGLMDSRDTTNGLTPFEQVQALQAEIDELRAKKAAVQEDLSFHFDLNDQYSAYLNLHSKEDKAVFTVKVSAGDHLKLSAFMTADELDRASERFKKMATKLRETAY